MSNESLISVNSSSSTLSAPLLLSPPTYNHKFQVYDPITAVYKVNKNGSKLLLFWIILSLSISCTTLGIQIYLYRDYRPPDILNASGKPSKRTYPDYFGLLLALFILNIFCLHRK